MKKKLLILSALFLFVVVTLFSQGSSIDETFWTKLNPVFSGSQYVMDRETCISCHSLETTAYEHTKHSRIFKLNSKTKLEKVDCEACHGPRSAHIENPDKRFAITDDQYSLVCEQCHKGGDRMYWSNSLHKSANVNCVTCHSVMEKKSSTELLSKKTELELCSTCHTDVTSKAMRMSSHPIKEGKMECSSCHNVHGAPGTGSLTKATSNETCYTCHQEKRGPFIWEHAPVREDCKTCHDPHGSNNKSMLVTQNASLCVSCHQYGGHINQYRYNRVSTPYGNGCVNCHTTIHGSNHPSGVKFTR
jgi:DmsE family decaheme c-type cytochrome